MSLSLTVGLLKALHKCLVGKMQRAQMEQRVKLKFLVQLRKTASY